MATARIPVAGARPAIWISSSAQNNSCTERRNAHSNRTARRRAKASASMKPELAPSATPRTAKATVHTTLIASMERRSGQISPATSRCISAHGLSALTARSDRARAIAAASRNKPETER